MEGPAGGEDRNGAVTYRPSWWTLPPTLQRPCGDPRFSLARKKKRSAGLAGFGILDAEKKPRSESDRAGLKGSEARDGGGTSQTTSYAASATIAVRWITGRRPAGGGYSPEGFGAGLIDLRKFWRWSAFGAGIGRSFRMSMARATVSVLRGELPRGECFMTASHCRAGSYAA